MNRVFVIALLVACGLAQAQNAPAPQPAQGEVPVRSAAEALQQARGSLLRATVSVSPDPNQARIENISFFAVPDPQPRTLKKHDLVTVIVREESEFKVEGSTDLKKDASLEAKLEEFIKLNLANYAVEGGGIGAVPPSIKAEASRDFTGEGSVDRSESLVLRVTAEVIDVKPNGTIVLQARQRITTDDEVQTFVLSGTCRAEDVTADNSILSTQMFDKDVVKTHTGAVRDSTKRGWVPKLLDALSPF